MRPLIAGNWRMHGLTAQLEQIATIAAAVTAAPLEADVLICVPSTLIYRAAQAADGGIAIGGEDCSAAKAGAFTGDVSADMLRDAGAVAVILGHSERRLNHHETDAMVAAKVLVAWAARLAAIICIGETLAQRRAGQTLVACGKHLAASLPDIRAGHETSIAYEPLWAIGSGHTPSAQDIVEVHAHIRSCLVARFGEIGHAVRILYGGSVTASNARSILGLAEVDGVLIGGASMTACDFNAVLDVTRSMTSLPAARAAE